MPLNEITYINLTTFFLSPSNYGCVNVHFLEGKNKWEQGKWDIWIWD